MAIEPFDLSLSNIPQNRKVGVPDSTVEQIAAVWDEEVSRILQRMIEIGREQRSFVPERGPAAYELVMIAVFLTPKVVDKHLSEHSLKDIDPVAERQALETPARKDRIEQTARMLAEHIWIQLLDKWQEKQVNLAVPVRSTIRSSGLRPRTTRNHYSPKFANRLWADSQGRLAVYTLKPGHEVDVRIRDAGKWGFEERLYSEKLELLLGNIESEAATPCKKLLRIIPLSEEERKHLITFLIAQWLRTPAFVLTQMSGIQRTIREQGIAFGTDIHSLRRVFEGSFENDALYSMMYRTIDMRSWRILVAPDGEGFVRPDSSIVIAGRSTNIYYPLTPKKCLHIGPDLADKVPPIIPLSRQLTSDQLAKTNAILISFAFESAITSPEFDSLELRRMLGRWFGTSRLVQEARRSLSFRYWGPLYQS